MKRGLSFAILVTLLLATTATATVINSTDYKPFLKQTFDIGQYHALVCTYVNDELVGQCEHNTWVDVGKNATAQYLGEAPGANAFNLISLGNTTAPASGSTAMPGEINDCGLENTTGSYQKSDDNVANWSIGHQWTSSCVGTIIVNTTGLFNGTGGTFFAGTDFTDASLTNGDKLTVNYTIWIT